MESGFRIAAQRNSQKSTKGADKQIPWENKTPEAKLDRARSRNGAEIIKVRRRPAPDGESIMAKAWPDLLRAARFVDKSCSRQNLSGQRADREVYEG